MIRSIKSVTQTYIGLSPLLSLTVWFFTGLVVMGAFGYEKLILPFFAVGLVNWLFVMVYFETYHPEYNSNTKTKDLLFSLYVTVGLLLSVYLILTQGSVILHAIFPLL
jgi:hypothetical protein